MSSWRRSSPEGSGAVAQAPWAALAPPIDASAARSRRRALRLRRQGLGGPPAQRRHPRLLALRHLRALLPLQFDKPEPELLEPYLDALRDLGPATAADVERAEARFFAALGSEGETGAGSAEATRDGGAEGP